MKTRLFVMMLVGGLLSGCGYHVPGAGGQWVGGNAKTLYVELFANRTAEPYLDTILVDEITAQLSRSRLMELTGARGDADLVLSGEVTSFSSSALAYNPGDDISEYRASMTATARLARRDDKQVLWQGNLSRSETYSTLADKGAQRSSESQAARVAARRLAEDLMSRLLDDF